MPIGKVVKKIVKHVTDEELIEGLRRLGAETPPKPLPPNFVRDLMKKVRDNPDSYREQAPQGPTRNPRGKGYKPK